MSQPNPPYVEPATAFRRRRKLVKPGIQLRLGAIFAGLTFLCLLLQWLLFSALLAGEADSMPVGSEYLLDLVPSLLFRSLAFSVLLALPLTLLAGVHATFRITGPIHRFEVYLRAVADGTQHGPCKIRKGDALGELCELINEATEPVRRRGVADRVDEAEARDAGVPPGTDESAAA
jgi:hypothetical protein